MTQCACVLYRDERIIFLSNPFISRGVRSILPKFSEARMIKFVLSIYGYLKESQKLYGLLKTVISGSGKVQELKSN